MRLPKPFYRLSVRFDEARLREEVLALPRDAWSAHPNQIAGNSAVRLISADGGENDEVDGVMLPTPHLERSPYLRQVLASFGVVWSRSRLLRLAPGAIVPEHADINYHWFNRVRMHIPIITFPQVRFYCGDQNVHMAAGEAWLFDNWRLHRVENQSEHERIHLVADTSGNAAFWQMVASSEASDRNPSRVEFDVSRAATPLTERTRLARVMSPGEVDLLVFDLRGELASRVESDAGRRRVAQYHGLLDAFCRDWRQLHALHASDDDKSGELARLRDRVREASRGFSGEVVMRTNQVDAHSVLEGRVLRPILTSPGPAHTAR